ncbi:MULTISPECIES: SDR family oxidoreductase [Cryobacterium]|uniref:SDR family oxidoreductase n=1 Tax=Cryobacterium TaxID=69578 RepID=UPI000CD40ADE|nr:MULTISPECIES: SDR family oxidoreductase [Cryobacterium]POH69838.1 3-ketoacyl-ACP reductase [Cryobacterium zongtaii]TFC42856.1 SDR family oxidoreductase [Cryobacterium sp. TMN-39-2]
MEPALHGRTALVTGVSRRKGIGYAVAVRLAELGASVFVQHFAPHDDAQPWGGDDLDAVRAGIRSALTEGAVFGDVSADLAEPDAATLVMRAAVGLTGRVDILVANHARSGGDGSIFDMTAAMLDGHWQVNARSTLLLTRAFAEQFGLAARPDAAGSDAAGPVGAVQTPRRPGERGDPAAAAIDEFATGRVIWLTSGQIHGPMPGEVAYAASKAVLAGLTPTVASELLDRGILLNTVNPGPVNTGYLDPETTDRPLDGMLEYLRTLPFGRFGEPTDPARLIAWLCTTEARWLVGQVLTSDGGFSLAN